MAELKLPHPLAGNKSIILTTQILSLSTGAALIVSTFDINVAIPPTVRIGERCHRSHNVILSLNRKLHDTVTYSSI